MNPAMQNYFKNTRPSNGGGIYITGGKGILIVSALKENEGFKGKAFILEAVVESSEPTPNTPEPNPAGQTLGWVQNFVTNPKMAAPNVMNFVCALMDETEESIMADALERRKVLIAELPAQLAAEPDEAKRNEISTAAHLWGFAEEFNASYRRLIGSSNPARGIRIGYYTTVNKDGRVFPRWQTIKPQLETEIAARRAKLDSCA